MGLLDGLLDTFGLGGVGGSGGSGGGGSGSGAAAGNGDRAASHAAASTSKSNANGSSSGGGDFCDAAFPAMWGRFVDHLTDVAYNRTCTAPADDEPRELPPLRLPPARRLVAIGDLHGDLDKARRAFRLAGLIGPDRSGSSGSSSSITVNGSSSGSSGSSGSSRRSVHGHADDVWTGGDTVAVQVGDILDRGDHELRLLYWLEGLQRQAEAAGGALHVLNGNHETMNAGGNFRYATAGADVEMAAWQQWVSLGRRLKANCGACSSGGGGGNNGGAAAESSSSDNPAAGGRPSGGGGGSARQFNPLRDAALRPGGPVARRFFAPHPTVLQVGSTLFVHGGVLPAHVEYGLERINGETRAWLLGGSDDNGNNNSSSGSGEQRRRPAPPAFLRGADAVVWARSYSARDEARCDCDALERVLAAVPGAERMVMGHTIQDRGINGACGGRALRVDVGLSRGCGDGEVQVLEIVDDGAHVARLREGAAPQQLSPPAPPALHGGGGAARRRQQEQQEREQQEREREQQRGRPAVPALLAGVHHQQPPSAAGGGGGWLPAAASWWRQQPQPPQQHVAGSRSSSSSSSGAPVRETTPA